MQFLKDDYRDSCTVGNFALLSARNDDDDDESSLFRLSATLFQKPHGTKQKVRGQGLTVALCF